MTKHLHLAFLFLTFLSCLLHAETKSLEEWWSGKRAGDLLGVRPTLEDRGLDDGAAYDPRTDRWRLLSDSPLEGRFGHVAVWSGDRMLIWGGATYSEDFTTEVAFDDGAAYYPDTDTWNRLPQAPLLRRQGAVGIWTGTDLIIWGGYAGDDHGDGAAYTPHDPAAR